MNQDDVLLDELVAPLRVRLSELDRLAAAKAAELKELHAAQSRIRRTIAYLDPAPKVVAKPKSSKLTAGPERTEAVRVYLQHHAGDLLDGFTAADLERQMEMNGGRIGPIERLRDALHELHSGGVIRLDRRTKGGGRLYKLVAPNG